MSTPPTSANVDVRGPRFAAWITSGVLALTLITNFWPLLAFQTVVFALGALLGPRRSPYGLLFARLVAPRLSPTKESEPASPVQFAQFVGFIFAAIGLIAYLSGAVLVGQIFVAFAFAAALLNAAFGICLGCKIYPLVARFVPRGDNATA
ncbi:DUF4395 domain-containing protein [Hoyosella rhizosphaerae]|uniref:DUF4395 domain-containing protein n=1 Tax=Hoyosella rhizosphaerae TaxID=1755582 RepID=A0A916UI08_9ACTN|nr:DUF4395 domain-containing protein [Hoyosella rhizosphaerae]MBN4928237.1 DUF4395 domain-containing protein [Hoyosella rhizosphaerae]GGC73440.1 hypothetical protein GCM10011410_28240 [Hoyosella rhizosphaerae]